MIIIIIIPPHSFLCVCMWEVNGIMNEKHWIYTWPRVNLQWILFSILA